MNIIKIIVVTISSALLPSLKGIVKKVQAKLKQKTNTENFRAYKSNLILKKKALIINSTKPSIIPPPHILLKIIDTLL